MQTDNPLLDFSGLPRYAAIRPEHITPAVDALLAENRALVASLTRESTPATWDDFVAPLEDANGRLGRAWGTVGHLHGVLDSPELRETYNANQPKVVEFYTELGQNEALFAKYKALRASRGFAMLSPTQQRIIDHELRDFRLSGAELAPEQKKRFAELQAATAKLSTRFSENVLDATNAFVKYIERAEELWGCRKTCSRPSAPPPRRTAARVGRSRCRCRRTSRSCSTAATARCARSSITPT